MNFNIKIYRMMIICCNVEAESPSDTTVLAWKFDHVDRNKDMVLQRNETNTLKNLVKQLMLVTEIFNRIICNSSIFN